MYTDRTPFARFTMLIPFSIETERHRALELLLSRHSPWPLVAPAPSVEEMAVVFAAAIRAPDHGQLRPWRFIVVRNEARAALGDLLGKAAQARDPDEDPTRYRAKATAAPLIIGLGVHVDKGRRITELEQILSVGAGAMNMLNALHMMGYGGFWVTVSDGEDALVKSSLGLGADDRLIGALYVGTPAQKKSVGAVERPDASVFVREWLG